VWVISMTTDDELQRFQVGLEAMLEQQSDKIEVIGKVRKTALSVTIYSPHLSALRVIEYHVVSKEQELYDRKRLNNLLHAIVPNSRYVSSYLGEGTTCNDVPYQRIKQVPRTEDFITHGLHSFSKSISSEKSFIEPQEEGESLVLPVGGEVVKGWGSFEVDSLDYMGIIMLYPNRKMAEDSLKASREKGKPNDCISAKEWLTSRLGHEPGYVRNMLAAWVGY
jgi:hypothetical protein